MGRELSLAAGVGAVLMYLFDPERGRRRRALLRDKLASAAAAVDDAADVTARDLSHRARGLVAEVRSSFAPGRVDDTVLVERVRAQIGRVVRHPGSIVTTASDGRFTLSGPILADEVDRLLARTRAVRGVREVVNRLEVHRTSGTVPGLQGHPAREEGRFELLQTYWSPTTRLLVGAAGGVLAFSGARWRNLLGVGLGSIGLALFARALTNVELRRLFGVGAGWRAVDIQKTITVAAPVERVFAFLAHPQNLPRFMSHVLEVRETGRDRSVWTVAGPAGVPITWESEITKLVPNRVLAWKTVPGSVVAHAGIVHFESTPDGGTRLDIKMSYAPPAGALGHVVAYLFGSDPKHAMDEDLARLKSLVEYGKTTAHGETVARENVAPEGAEQS